MERAGLVCVIGAGPSGLAALKALKERGLHAVCFEKSDRVGGVWALETALGKTSAYRSLHINTSREKSQFSDFPMPEHYPDYPGQADMFRYFEAYATHFDLKPSIRFLSEVSRVSPRADGTFQVQLRAGEVCECRALVVANGHHSDPYWPEPALPGHFDGPRLHARDYLDPDRPVALRGRRVVVIGMGNSAMDIACELAYAGARVLLSTRRGAFVIPKWIAGKPVDQRSLLPRWLPARLRRNVNQRLLELLVGGTSAGGLPAPDHRLGEAHPTISSELSSLLRTGRVLYKPAVLELLGDRLRFADGSSESVDAMVYCTGYNVRFPFFAESFVSAPNNDLPLYLRVHEPGVENLYFIGLCQPVGALMPIAEAQARWVSELCSGEASLPSIAQMKRQVAREREKLSQRYVRTRRHTMQVDVEPYLRALELERQRGRERARSARATLTRART